MVDNKSPRYLRTAYEKTVCNVKGELRYERNIIIEGNDKDDVREAIKYLSARLL